MKSDTKFFAASRAQRTIDEADPAREAITRLRAWDNDNLLKQSAADCLEERWRRIVELEESRKLASYLQQENEVLIERVRFLEISLSSEREACAKVAENLASNTQQLLLHSGEMEPQELLTSKAVLKLVASLIRGRGER